MIFIERDGEEHRKLSHDNDLCVGCGICSDICPTSALNLGPIVPVARGLIEMDLISIKKNNCVLCGLCSASCPFGALSLEINGEKISEIDNYPKWTNESNINTEDCIYCGKCNQACPQDAIFFNRKLPDANELVRGTIEVEKDNCIYCSICAEMCPVGAISLSCESENTKFSVLNNIEIDESKCVYCGVCKRACPEGAIKAICSTCMEREDLNIPSITGEVFIESKCVNCGWCESVCPVDAVKITKPFTGEILRDEDLICKGDTCHACMDVCPCNAVTIENNESVINPEFCCLCGACTKACPQSILSTKRKSMEMDNIKSLSWNRILGKLIS